MNQIRTNVDVRPARVDNVVFGREKSNHFITVKMVRIETRFPYVVWNKVANGDLSHLYNNHGGAVHMDKDELIEAIRALQALADSM